MRFLKPLFSTRLASVAQLSVLAAAMTGFSGLAVAQDGANANLSDDIAFARDLARYRYFDLAISWLDDLEKGGKFDAGGKSELGLARATIARIASQFAPKRDERKKYFDEAIGLYRTAIGDMQELDAEKGEDVIDGLCAALIDKGKFWADELLQLRANEAPDADLKTARANAEDAFKEAVKTLNQASDLLSQAAGGSNVPAATVTRLEQLAQFALYRKGEAYYNWAATYDASEFSREDNLKKCIEAMNDYIWEAGNESIWAFWSSYYMGVAEFELSRGSAAKNYAEFVPHHEKALAMLTHTFDPDGGVSLENVAEQGLAENELTFVLEVVERAYLSTAQVYRAAANNFEAMSEEPKDLDKFAQMYAVYGDKEGQVKSPVDRPSLVVALRSAGVARIDELKARFQKHKFEFGDYGYRALLEQASLYVDLGAAGKGVGTVTEIAQKKSGTLVGLQAQAMLSQLLSSDSGAQSAQVWHLSATGAFSESRWLDAIEDFHKCIASATTPEDQKEFAVDAWSKIGVCYLQVSRHLEAALAYEQGLEAARASGMDDLVAELAIDAYNAWSARFTQTKDPFDQGQRDRVRKIVTDLGASPDVQYFVARETFTNAQAEKDAAKKKALYAQAEGEFSKVTDTSIYYERALVYLARCQDDAGNPDKAISTFETFFKRVDDPNGIAPEGKRAKNREIARAEAVYYRAGVLLIDKKDFAAALKTLDGYEKTFPNQQPFFPLVQNFRVQCQVGLGKRAEAEAIVVAMLKDAPTHAATTSSLNQIATAYSEGARTARDAKNDADIESNIAKAAEYLGMHNEKTGFASFANLRYVADWHAELAELSRKKGDDAARDASYGRAKENYARLLDKFGKNAAFAKTIETEVMAGYGKVLIGLQDFQTASPIWRKLYDANRRNQEAAENHAKCLGGWIEFSNRKFLEITGTGQHKEAALVWADLRKALELANQKHTPGWWYVSTQLVYELYLSGKTNPADSKEALNIINNWKALLPELGGTPSKECLLRIEVELQKK
jgi:hypothetical protein